MMGVIVICHVCSGSGRNVGAVPGEPIACLVCAGDGMRLVPIDEAGNIPASAYCLTETCLEEHRNVPVNPDVLANHEWLPAPGWKLLPLSAEPGFVQSIFVAACPKPACQAALAALVSGVPA